MLNPSVIDLVTGVADGLTAEVVPELPPGPAQDQVRAAIAVLRRVARALPGLSPYLHADIADVAATLTALGVTPALDTPPTVGTPLDELLAIAQELRQQLAEFVNHGARAGEHEAVLSAALGRLTERDSGLRLSPWER